jgi:hypothetical protein
MEQDLKESVFDQRIKKLRTISDIFKFLDINKYSEVLNDDYFKDVSFKTFRVFYELSILWLQFELPELLLQDFITKNQRVNKFKIYKKIRSISTEKIKKKINETGLMEIASEIYAILDSINIADRADEIFKLDENFFRVSPEEMINRISVKIEEERFLLNELSEVLKRIVTTQNFKTNNQLNKTEH